jgi:hypothetical protein
VEEVEVPDATELETLWIKKHSDPKQKNISDNQQPSEDKRVPNRIYIYKKIF